MSNNLLTPVFDTKFLLRFISKLETQVLILDGKFIAVGTDCWPWCGAITHSGYGTIELLGRSAYAHRVSIEFVYGSLTPGMQVHHICGNPLCVNPFHLVEVTPHEHHQLHGKETPPDLKQKIAKKQALAIQTLYDNGLLTRYGML